MLARKTLPLIASLTAIALTSSATELPSPRDTFLGLQLFLDAKNFGPGKLDGHWGQFTQAAVDRWNRANPESPIKLSETGEPDPEQVSKLRGSQDLYRKYTISERDFDLVSKIPENPADQARKESLLYESVLSRVSEIFHSDPDLIRELNPEFDWNNPSVNAELLVPNVARPYDPDYLTSNNRPKAVESAAGMEVKIDLSSNILEVTESGNLIASFPVTVGAQGNETPSGDSSVQVIQWMPEFRYDEKMLEEGERSDNAHMLPPGPGNPVGIIWIGLEEDGIGIHGTNNADDIGRNDSAGCIRLSNWDADALGRMVAVGTKVILQGES